MESLHFQHSLIQYRRDEILGQNLSMYNVQGMNFWGMGAEQYCILVATSPTNLLLQKRTFLTAGFTLTLARNQQSTWRHILKTINLILTATTSSYDNKHWYTRPTFLLLISLINNIPAGSVCYK